MNFCKESELYISLYIDNELEEKVKKEFLDHMEQCPECAQKLREESYFAGLCKAEESVKLPTDFSSSLHAKLLKVTENENKSNAGRYLFNNKKVIAGLSAAAVMVISILAYSLLPDIGVKKNEMSEAVAQDQTVAASASTAASAADEAGSAAPVAGASDEAAPKEPEVEVANGFSGDIKFSKSYTYADDSKTNEGNSKADAGQSKQKAPNQMAMRNAETVSKQTAKDQGQLKEKAPEEPVAAESIQGENSTEMQLTLGGVQLADENRQYISSYAEMQLKISAGSEYDNLKKFMSEFGAVEEKSIFYGVTAGTPGNPEYVDYSMPVALYDSLKIQALLKYNLQLLQKTDIIKKDITGEYNELNSQKLEIQKKIDEALTAGEDAADLEYRNSILAGEINELVEKSKNITVRIFLISK